jgi:antitoxin HicB
MTCHYSMIIQWSEEDQVYIVTLREFHNNKTHGDTYEEAVKNGHEVLELLIETYLQDGRPLPEPLVFPTSVQSA